MRGDNLFVVNNGTAEVRTVVVERRDAQNVLIKSGLNDGDVVILSNVQNGQKVKVEE
jgi:multidrug efflux pump subunit AcrA (membrane-fusion protein)